MVVDPHRVVVALRRRLVHHTIRARLRRQPKQFANSGDGGQSVQHIARALRRSVRSVAQRDRQRGAERTRPRRGQTQPRRQCDGPGTGHPFVTACNRRHRRLQHFTTNRASRHASTPSPTGRRFSGAVAPQACRCRMSTLSAAAACIDTGSLMSCQKSYVARCVKAGTDASRFSSWRRL